MKWIVVANSNLCRIYEYENNVRQLKLIDQINHPENKFKVHDLITDHPGHYKSGSSNRGSYVPSLGPLQIAIDGFAREVAVRLNKGRNKHSFDDLTFLMPPEMEGLIGKHLNRHVAHAVDRVIQKNLMHLSEHELKQYLGKALCKNQWVH